MSHTENENASQVSRGLVTDADSSSMVTRSYQIRFLTPAFLGDAEQSGAWRTPPFKALLRQWWRVVYAFDHGFRVRIDDMRHEEGQLLGHAWLESDTACNGQKVSARRSALRMRLGSWAPGKLTSWSQPDLQIRHPEVSRSVGANLYLGYGPLTFRGGSTALKSNAAIQQGEAAVLSLALPRAHVPRVEQALWLIRRYGAIGGRSRNGWGSVDLSPLPGTSAPCGTLPLRDWEEALSLDWPHAVGTEGGVPLEWITGPMADWKQVMRLLSEIKIGLRTQFKFPDTAPPHDSPHPRHWLSYPITRHATRAWNRNARLPNSLRFRVRQDAGGRFHGVLFHVPCLPPHDFKPDLQSIRRTWREVHRYLDSRPDLTRLVTEVEQ